MQSLKKTYQFRYIYSKGKSKADKYLVLHYKQNGLDDNRYGISASHKVGHAVVRNKIRRRIKEILRLNSESISKGYDIIFVVRVRCAEADYWQIQDSVMGLLAGEGLCRESKGEDDE